MERGPLAPVLDALLGELRTGVKENRSLLESSWPTLVGRTFAPHTRASLLGGGTLCVWVDDSTLAYELSRKFQGTILKRAQEALGEGAIKKIIFRVGEIEKACPPE